MRLAITRGDGVVDVAQGNRTRLSEQRDKATHRGQQRPAG